MDTKNVLPTRSMSAYHEVLNRIMPLPDYAAHKDRTNRRVYFLHAPELRRVKIGFSTNPHVRSIKVRHDDRLPHEITLIVFGSLDGGRVLERLMHERFAAHRVSGEWFDDEILPDVERLIEDELAWFGDAA